MNNNHKITKIDHHDPTSKAALEAEQQLFAHYGLEYQVHFVEMRDPPLRLRILEVGDGPSLLMVPGGSGDAWPLVPLMAELKGWRILAVNRPGGGLSDGIDHLGVDVRQLAVNTLKTVMDAFNLEQVPIVCNSMGGLWSMWYALEYPTRVSKMAQLGCPALILKTSAPFFMRLIGVPVINNFVAPNMQPKNPESALDGLRFQGSSQADINRIPKVTAQAAYHFYQLPTYLDTWKTLIGAVATLKGANPRYQLTPEQLLNVNQPVQFVWGKNDPFGNLDVARQVLQIVPNAELYEMNTGHLPFLDQPEESGRVIREFLYTK